MARGERDSKAVLLVASCGMGVMTASARATHRAPVNFPL
jgi:hypothetical protein